MKCHFYLYCIAFQLALVPAAHAYSTADLNKLISTNKCVGCDLSGVDLSRKQLVNADLQAANLVGAKLTSTNLTGAKLGGANLTGADLSNTNLSQAVLQAVSAIDVNFVGTNLTNTDLTYANLVNTNFSRAILRNTNLGSANLALADFTGANLTALNLADANLTGAKGVNSPASGTIQQPPAPITPSRDRTIKPNVEEGSPIFRRRPVYRIPADLGKPQRLVPGGTRVIAPPGTNE
jgi:Pentapeptide repeats (8 copies)